jgi:uncharacterized protein (DUF433 family)
MELESYFDFSHGEIRIQGTRVYLDNVIYYYNEGMRPEDITRHLPSLRLEQIYASITYYLANRKMVDEYMEEKERDFEEKWQEQQRNPSPVRERLQALKPEYLRQLASGKVDFDALLPKAVL